MKNTPTLDRRRRQDIMAELAAHAGEYTPEWRYEGALDDPGSALTQLFGDMFYETVDRMNSLPEKLYTQFLDMTGFRMPDPASAAGLMCFTAHDTVTEPVPVPRGTQVFTETPEGENIVYETSRRIEATSAQLQDIFFTDPRAGVIERLDMSRRNSFFESVGGENLQKHRFSFGEDTVLKLCGPFTVEVELRQAAGADTGTVARLTDPQKGRWTIGKDGQEEPFDAVTARDGVIELKYSGSRNFGTGGESRTAITYTALEQGEDLVLEGIRLKSRPDVRSQVDSAANGDVELDLETGDYCLGRRPGAYSTCYLRSDGVFSKRGARAAVELDIVPVITEAPDAGTPQYQFNQRIIDKKDAVTVVPDDVYVSQVVWEYYNGLGWRALKVSGDKNPFSCKREGRLEMTFDIPEDLSPVEVNAEEGYYIRARVVYMENEFSQVPRWVVPFMKGAACSWSYSEGVPVKWCEAENNAETVLLEDVSEVSDLSLLALKGLEDHPAAMYLSFLNSPHAMPLAIYFDVAGPARLEDKLRIEAWNGTRFEPVRWVDMTRNLLHAGTMILFLPKELPTRRLFGEDGCWIRLMRSSYTENRGRMPVIAGVRLNVVEAVQRESYGTEVFSTEGREPGKTIELLRTPVQNAGVWVDEVSELPVAEAEQLKSERPGDVRLEWDDLVLTHCWVRWERVSSLALCGPQDRGCELDPYTGTVTFGDGVHGRVLPTGIDIISVEYSRGGGSKGNAPSGAVTNAIGSLPRISELVNITAMSGGTDRFTLEKAEEIGNKRLRNRGRAAGARDFEEIVTLSFPEARHVKCFTNRDMRGGYAPGHVCVVVEGSDPDQSRAVDDLCRRIYEDLSRRCDCVLAAEGRLHVISSTVLTVSVTVQAEMADPDMGAVTQQEIAERLTELIDTRWRQRDIGSQVRLNEIWQTVRDTSNVKLVRSVLTEGVCHVDGMEKLIPLESDDAIPYATVRSGAHIVQII